jgi:hypothetical protein
LAAFSLCWRNCRLQLLIRCKTSPPCPPTQRGRQGPLGTYFPDAASSSLGTSIFLDDAMICTTHNLLKLFALAKAA